MTKLLKIAAAIIVFAAYAISAFFALLLTFACCWELWHGFTPAPKFLAITFGCWAVAAVTLNFLRK